jgi:hypothetical protein
LRPLFSAFDKIAYIKSSQNTFETGKCKVVRSFSALFRQDDDAPDASSKKISDHLPLWAEFKVNELTQELNATVKRM